MQYLRLFLFSACAMVLVGCQCPCKKTNAASMSPVDSSIEQLLRRLKLDGITKENVKTKDLSAYSTGRVRMDASGAVQSYIQVKELLTVDHKKLGKLGVRIDTENAAMKVLQAWVPFYNVEKVARLPFVTGVKAPSYGRTR